MAKRLILTLLFLPLAHAMSAYMPYYDIKAKVLAGGILKHTKHLENTVKGPTLGLELAVEFLPQGKYSWEKYWNYPVIGVGVLGMDLGNNAVFGQAFAAYPYVLVPMVRSKYIQANFKVGVGLAVLTKTWYDCDTEHGVNAPTANAAIGSHLNVFIPFGLSLDFPIKRGFSVTTDVMWNHISNGSFIQPNSGLNIVNGFVGVGYRPNWREYMFPWRDYVRNRAHNVQMEFAFSGGARQLYYKDKRFYGIATGRISVYKILANVYKIGGSIDAFYDGVFVNQGEAGGDYHTRYGRYSIADNDVKNKFRVGLSIANEFEIGRVVAGIHWGVYLYDPIRNAYSIGTNPKYEKGGRAARPMFYSYNIEKEDGWNYFRLLLKCRIVDNLFVSASLKTHLQKAEFFDIGLGYTINFKSKRASYAVLE